MPVFSPRNVRVLAAQAKKRSTRLVLLALTIFVVVVSITSEPKSTSAFSSGSGTIADPYVITSCAELQEIDDVPEYMYASFVLGGNIDCSSIVPFSPLGVPNTFSTFLPFMGRFDGQGYTISNVTMGSTTAQYVGIFSDTWGASIRNVNLDNFTVDGINFVSALAARSNGTSIVGVSLTNSTITIHGNTASYVGSMVGRFIDSYGYGLYATSTSITTTGTNHTTGGSGSSAIGALIGNHLNSVLDRSASGVSVVADYSGIGGLVGTMQTGSVIKNSYTDSVVTGYDNVGGVVGSYTTYLANDYEIDSVYSNANITATNPTAYTGGILGYEDSGSGASLYIRNSFSVGRIASTTRSGGITGSTLSSTQLINNVWYPTGTGQTRCSGGVTVYAAGECTSNNTASYYYSSANAPLNKWDFVGAWNEYGAALPDLQVFPFVEPATPTAITTCTDLATNIRQDPNGWYALSNDIDCAGDTNLLPLTGTTSNSLGFVGIFDGQGNTISGITLSANTTAAQYYKGVGLFRQIYGATIQDVLLEGGGITSLTEDINGIGALAGKANGVVIDGVTSTVPVHTGDAYGGGLVGTGSGFFNNVSVNADIDYTYAAGDATAWIGGISGNSYFIQVTNSSFSGSIKGSYYVGGLVGYASQLIVDNSVTSGTILGNSSVGGIFGRGDNDNISLYSLISNSTSSATIGPDVPVGSYSNGVGGIAGDMIDIHISSTHFSGTINTGIDYTSGIGGIIGFLDTQGPATSSISNVSTNAYILSDGSNGNYPYVLSVGGIIGGVSDKVSLQNINASSTIRLGAEPATNYINGYTNIGGLVGQMNQDSEIISAEVNGSIYVYDDYTGINGGYGYALGGFVGSGCCANIESSTSSVDIFVKSYEVGAIGGLYGEGGQMTIRDTNVTGPILVQAVGDTYDVGGFIGYSYSNVISNSSVAGDVTIVDSYGPYEIGGFFGVSYSNTLDQIYTDNTLTLDIGNDGTSAGNSIGGFVGLLGGTNTYTNTYASTTVSVTSAAFGASAGTDIGGYTGTVSGATDSISNSYSSGSLTLIADVTAPFNNIGGFIGSSVNDTNSFTNNFTVTDIPAIASSTNVGAFIGSYNGGETFANNAFDATETGQTLCTGIDAIDPAWCTVRNIASAEPTYFYDSANAPMSVWDFAGTWIERVLDYPIFGSSGGGGSTPPTVGSTAGATSITQTGGTIAGNITSLGTGTVTDRGFYYGLTPLLGATTTESSAGFSTGAFSTILSGLVCNTTYYFQAYATSADGTGTGSTESFTTVACSGTPPTVATNVTASGVTKEIATVTGNITALGTDLVTTRGFVYGRTSSFGATTTETSAGFTTGAFSTGISSLTCNTMYNFAAYATSVAGTAYGATGTFTTNKCSSGASATKTEKNKDTAPVSPVVITPAPTPPPVSPVVLTPTPTAVPTLVPEPEPTPVEVCGTINNATTVKTVLDDSSVVTISIPNQAVRSATIENTGTTDYSLYLQVNPLNGKGVQKQISKFVALIEKIADKKDEGDTLPPGLVKKVGTVTYVPPTSAQIITTTTTIIPGSTRTTIKPNTRELKISNTPCPEDESVNPPLPPTTPPVPPTPTPTPIIETANTDTPAEPNNDAVTMIDEETGETITVTDIIVGDEIFDLDFSGMGDIPPEILIPPFEVIVTDEFGNVVESFDKPFEISIYSPEVLGLTEDEIYVVKLGEDGETWFEVPFSIDGDTLRLTISDPGRYFIWKIPKALAAAGELPDTELTPINLQVPLRLANGVIVAGFLSGLLLLLLKVSKLPFSLDTLHRSIVLAWNNLIGLITFRKRRRPWGTVYDSVTKVPIDPAYVELFDLKGEKQAEAITDLDGRYGFLVPDGHYVMQVRKTNYIFPSQYRKLLSQDVLYSQLYFGGDLLVDDTVVHDVPMDPEQYDWNQFEKLRTNQTKFYHRLDPLIVNLLDMTFFAGLLFMAWQFLANPTMYAGILGAVYLAMFILRFFVGKPALYGTIKKDGKPLAFALVKVIQNGRTLQSKVSDEYGRYVAMVAPGTYTLEVQERTGEESYTTILTKSVRAKKGVINRRVRV